MTAAIGASSDVDSLTRGRRQLRRIGLVGVVDTALLVPLLAGALTGHHGLAPMLGPVHGLVFLYELYLVVQGVGERWWGWWYVIAIAITGGPLGLAVGHPIARRAVERRLASG